MENSSKKYEVIIEALKGIKLRLDNKAYEKGENLKLDFVNTICGVWRYLDNLDKEDLKVLYEVHKFLIDEVITIHEGENSSVNETLLKTNLNIRDISDSLEEGKRAFRISYFKNDDCDYYLIGDVHSDAIIVQKILENTRFFERVVCAENIKLIFIGDYVDRGKSHFRLLQHVLSLKYLFPKNIFLQKGNHDTGKLIDGKIKMGVRKSAKSLEKDWFLLYLYNLVNKNPTLPFDMIESYLAFFDSLTVTSFIVHENNILMIAHAGIPRPRDEESYFGYINSLASLTDEEVKDNIGKTIVNNIIWSDPSVGDKNLKENKGRFKFTESHFEEFRGLIGFDRFIRGHEVETKGYNKIYNDRFITIFSSGRIYKDGKNVNSDTAYTNVNPHIINFTRDGEIVFVDLNE